MRAASDHAGPWPIVSIWHGDADYTACPGNLTESMKQWTDVHGSGRTQLRLRLNGFPLEAGYLWIGNGASARLRVEYLP